MQHAVKLVAFDMDGTLTRSELFGIKSHRAALHDFNLPPLTDEQILSVYGTKAHDYMPTLLPGLTPEQIHEYLVAVGKYPACVCSKVRPMLRRHSPGFANPAGSGLYAGGVLQRPH